MVTGPDTHFLLVEVQHDISRLFDNKLSGTVWVDDVSLAPLLESGKPGPQ